MNRMSNSMSKERRVTKEAQRREGSQLKSMMQVITDILNFEIRRRKSKKGKRVEVIDSELAKQV